MKLDTQFNPPNASMIPFISFLLLNFGTMYAMKEVEWFWILNYVSRLVLDIEGEQKGGKIVLNEKLVGFKILLKISRVVELFLQR